MSSNTDVKKTKTFIPWTTIIIFIGVIIVGLVIYELGGFTSPSSIDHFDTNVPANLKDALNWSTINSNKGYKIILRIPNIKILNHNDYNNHYSLQNDLYQAFVLDSIKNPHPMIAFSKTLYALSGFVYIVPMDVARYDVSAHQFITTDTFSKNNPKYPFFSISNNIALRPAPNGTGRVSYFLIDASPSNLEVLDIPLGLDPPVLNHPTKLSAWSCGLKTIDLRMNPPAGYRFVKFDNNIVAGKTPTTPATLTPCAGDNGSYRPRFRATYQKI